MTATLQKQFEKIEANRKSLLAELKNYSDETINKKPSPEAWSVSEVITHLITAEEASLKYLQRKLQDTSKSEKEGLKHKWRWLLINVVFTFNIPFKAPDIVAPKSGYRTLAELETKWETLRGEIYTVLAQLPESEAQKDLWKHAVAGKLNLYHMVQFFGIHFNRHRKQINKTLKIVTQT